MNKSKSRQVRVINFTLQSRPTWVQSPCFLHLTMTISPSDHCILCPAFSLTPHHAHAFSDVASLFWLEFPLCFLKGWSKYSAWAEEFTHCSVVGSLLLPWQSYWNYNLGFFCSIHLLLLKLSYCLSMALLLPNPASMSSCCFLFELWSGIGLKINRR